MFNSEDLKQYTTTQQGSTKIVSVPAGEYAGVISEKLEFRQSPGKKDPSKLYTFLDVDIKIDDARVREVTKRESPTVRYSCGIDLTADGKGFDMSEGKNVGLNRLRAAVHQNEAGLPWSPQMLVGKALKVKVDMRPNPNDPESPYAEASAVAPL